MKNEKKNRYATNGLTIRLERVIKASDILHVKSEILKKVGFLGEE